MHETPKSTGLEQTLGKLIGIDVRFGQHDPENCDDQRNISAHQRDVGKPGRQPVGVRKSRTCHFHDLRHEAGSRMMEAGWPIHHVQQMLGHADLKQTSTYLNVTRSGLQESMKRFGTAPLHVVAPEADQEHQPTCNDVAPSEKQVTVN